MFVKTDKKFKGRNRCCCFGYFFKKSLDKQVAHPRLELPSYDLYFEYNMNHKSRGIALIFSHEKFLNSNCFRRVGTSLDRDNLSTVLKAYNFEIKLFNDLSVDEIIDEINKVASLNHCEKDCLLVTIMTHGEENNILHAYDKSFSLDLLTSAFTDKKCPSLSGKPRIFFIQACRGTRFDQGVEVFGTNIQRYTLNRASIDDVLDSNPFTNVVSPFYEEDLFFSPPTIHKDYLIVRSTMAKHFSFRNTATGSWFIQTLCEELAANGETYDILNLLTHINWKISERESEGNIKGKKQIILISSMLTKLLILNKHSEHFKESNFVSTNL